MVMPSLSLVRHPGWCGPGLNTGFRPAAGDSDSRTGPSYQLTGASAGQVRGSDVSRRRAGAEWNAWAGHPVHVVAILGGRGD